MLQDERQMRKGNRLGIDEAVEGLDAPLGELVVDALVFLEPLELLARLLRHLEIVVALLHLAHKLGLEERVLEEAGPHRPEAGVRRREENTRDVDDVAGRDRPRERAVQVNRHRPGDVADGHLVGLAIRTRTEEPDRRPGVSESGAVSKLQRCARTISWILTSWNGTNLLARVCMMSEPLTRSCRHVAVGHSCRGRKLRELMTWKVSSPQASHE